MGFHHVRDREGNLHSYDDAEYKSYKRRKGCYTIITILVCISLWLWGAANGDKKSSSNTEENVTNSKTQESIEENENPSTINTLMHENVEEEKSSINEENRE